MNKRLLSIGVASLFLTAIGCNSMMGGHKSGEADEHEVKMKFADVPPAVQQTIQREANGQAISNVDQEQRKGQTVYEADARIDGRNYEIVVDKEGHLVSKALDNEENEQGEKAGGKEDKD